MFVPRGKTYQAYNGQKGGPCILQGEVDDAHCEGMDGHESGRPKDTSEEQEKKIYSSITMSKFNEAKNGGDDSRLRSHRVEANPRSR